VDRVEADPFFWVVSDRSLFGFNVRLNLVSCLITRLKLVDVVSSLVCFMMNGDEVNMVTFLVILPHS
jgi:hypothetical protein